MDMEQYYRTPHGLIVSWDPDTSLHLRDYLITWKGEDGKDYRTTTDQTTINITPRPVSVKITPRMWASNE